ncbi:hypothetical protein ATANTOWER_004565 [Ataeniobius toweri]|uniref:Uncharacterized protein n=1 Tax=Ataeniobius toweri TaxID=208326 RepID=A0ABU7BTR3_9TELE|nr:hypothetical protein [Ataeniobius toweri]
MSFCPCHSPGHDTLGIRQPPQESHKPTIADRTPSSAESIPYCRCPPSGSGIAAATGTSDLTLTATGSSIAIEAENIVHSDSMTPTWSKLSQRWELNTFLVEGSTRCSQQTLAIRLGLPSFLLFQRIQLQRVEYALFVQ